MPFAHFINQGRPRSAPNDGPGFDLWDVLGVIGSAAIGAGVAVVARGAVARTSWSPRTQSLAVAGGGVALGMLGVLAGRDVGGAALAAGALAVTASGYAPSPPPPTALAPSVTSAGAPAAPVHDAAWVAAAPRLALAR